MRILSVWCGRTLIIGLALLIAPMFLPYTAFVAAGILTLMTPSLE